MKDPAFDRHAPQVAAVARERQLQSYRELFSVARVDTARPETIAAIDWVESLADVGHVGAQRLLERAIGRPEVLVALHRHNRQLLQRAGRRSPVNPQHLACAILESGEPDPAELEELLPTGPREWAVHSAHLRLLREAGIAPQQQDFRELATLLRDPNDLPTLRDTGLLFLMAKWRTASDDDAVRAVGERLAHEAVTQGSRAAMGLVWDCEQRRYGKQVGQWPLSTQQQGEFTCQWFADGRPEVEAARPLCLWIGMAFENHAEQPDLERAITWYERGIGRAARQEGQEGLAGDFCAAVATQLSAFPAFSQAWRRRAQEAGEPWSVARWLNEQLGENGTHPADLRPALEQFARNWTAPPRDRWYLSDAVRAMLALARKLEAASPPDVDTARQWRELADLIDPQVIDIPR